MLQFGVQVAINGVGNFRPQSLWRDAYGSNDRLGWVRYDNQPKTIFRDTQRVLARLSLIVLSGCPHWRRYQGCWQTNSASATWQPEIRCQLESSLFML